MNNPPNYDYGSYNRDTAWPYDGDVVLDFGRPAYANGIFQTLLPQTSIYAIPAQIINCVQQYITGFWLYTPPSYQYPPKVRVLIGTNNLFLSNTDGQVGNPTDAYGHGNMWAGLVNKVSDWANASGYSGQITVGAASDIELSWSLHSGTGGGSIGSGNTKGVDNWLSGYNSRAQHTIYNFGSLDGCPPYANGTTPVYNGGNYCPAAEKVIGTAHAYPAGVGSDWYLDNVWWVTKGFPGMRAIPELYSIDPSENNSEPDQAKQWQQVSLNGYLYHNGLTLWFWVAMADVINYSSNSTNTKDAAHAWEKLGKVLYNNDPPPMYSHANSCVAPPNCHRTNADTPYSTYMSYDVRLESNPRP